MLQVDIYEFVALWEYIGGDKFMEAEKKEIHEWTAMCERYDGGGKGEAGGLTLTEMRQMVAENNVCAEGEQGMARLEKQWMELEAKEGAQGWLPYELAVQVLRNSAGVPVAAEAQHHALPEPEPEPEPEPVSRTTTAGIWAAFPNGFSDDRADRRMRRGCRHRRRHRPRRRRERRKGGSPRASQSRPLRSHR